VNVSPEDEKKILAGNPATRNFVHHCERKRSSSSRGNFVALMISSRRKSVST
jgi:hypothetical protein